MRSRNALAELQYSRRTFTHDVLLVAGCSAIYLCIANITVRCIRTYAVPYKLIFADKGLAVSSHRACSYSFMYLRQPVFSLVHKATVIDTFVVARARQCCIRGFLPRDAKPIHCATLTRLH